MLPKRTHLWECKVNELTSLYEQMLPKRTHLWECIVNELTSLYEQSNESIEVNAYLILMMT